MISRVVIRCSELDRILLCPGSLTLCGIVAPRKGDEGVEGSALHQLAHAKMIAELGASGEPGRSIECKSIGFSKWIAEYYFRFVRETAPLDWSLQVETPVAYDFDRFTLSGHIDALAMSPDGTEAIIFDLKTGYDPVDPADQSEQVFGYGCLLIRAYPGLKKVTGYIIQPRNDEDEGFKRISDPMVLEGAILAASLASLESRVNVALDNSIIVNSGPKQCLWCPAALQCPATIAARDSMKIELTEDHLAQIKAEPDDALLASWVVAGRILSRPLDDAKGLAKERIGAKGSITAEDGTVITAKTGPGAYKYPDPGAYLKALRVLLPRDEDLARAVNPSISKAIEVIAEVNDIPKTSKVGQSATAIVNGSLKPLTIQGERVTLQFSMP
jgi:hypothetical protein